MLESDVRVCEFQVRINMGSVATGEVTSSYVARLAVPPARVLEVYEEQEQEAMVTWIVVAPTPPETQATTYRSDEGYGATVRRWRQPN